jgi:hypothetical protein
LFHIIFTNTKGAFQLLPNSPASVEGVKPLFACFPVFWTWMDSTEAFLADQSAVIATATLRMPRFQHEFAWQAQPSTSSREAWFPDLQATYRPPPTPNQNSVARRLRVDPGLPRALHQTSAPIAHPRDGPVSPSCSQRASSRPIAVR